MRCGTALTASVILVLSVCAGASAKDKPAAQPQAPATAAAPQPAVAMPDAEEIVRLLRSTLNTLNDAIQTGNFTVLRDVGAPGFRAANSAARLSRSFSDLASKGVDLSVVNVIAPQLTEAPSLNPQNGMLNLKGYFPGQPVQINFEMLYQPVGGRWRLFGLSVQPATSTTPPLNVTGDASRSQPRSNKRR